jgi:hypothetical protein
MCRSIKVLRVPSGPATRDEISAAALQFVRKVSGSRKASRVNEPVFNRAVVEISACVARLLEEMGPAKSRLVSVSPAEQGQAADQSQNGASHK